MAPTTLSIGTLGTYYRRAVVVFAHVLIFVVALFGAFVLRFDGQIPGVYVGILLMTLPIFIVVKLSVFTAFRQFRGWWRYVSLEDMMTVGRATVVSIPIVVAAVYLAGFREFPRSVFVLDALLSGLGLATLRVGIRLLRERLIGQGVGRDRATTPTLIVGTGLSAEGLLRETLRTSALGLRVVGLVSEDPRHVGDHVSGVRILGTPEEIPRLVRIHDVTQVVIAVEPGEGDLIRRVVAQCASADIKYRVLPSTAALVQGQVQISHIRDVALQDLLGRPPVRLQMEPIAALISGETVLVTGAGGSIGSELCRQVASFGVEQLVLLEQAENPLFHLERELLAAHPSIRLVAVVADIHDGERLAAIMREYRPRIVLHAAAHKHVPLMEKNPGEAIKNNIRGTLNVIRAAQRAEVERCVLISTDKAVNPTSVMGASKRVAEMLMQSLVAESTTVLCAVRFGNVLGSNGSVIPIFQEQIARGGPITVTHPEMRRYFMTIPEATQLVLQAATFATPGDIFVLDMGEPVYIVDVARDLIRLSGLRPDVDIQIEFSGMRPGEKLYEELTTDRETSSATSHERIFRCHVEAPQQTTLLEATERLETLARTGTSPQHLRRAIFDVLDALEHGESPDRIRTLAENVVALPDRSRSV